jgi:hypothetical protein
VYLLEEPPSDAEAPLKLEIPDQLLNELNETHQGLSKEQISKIIYQREELAELVGEDVFERLRDSAILQNSDWDLIRTIAYELKANPSKWRGLSFLHSNDPDKWDNSIYNILRLRGSGWDTEYSRFVEFVKILTRNWTDTVPSLLNSLRVHKVGVEMFFKLERNVSFKFASLLHDVNVLQKELLPENHTDVSPFIRRASSAFLPRVVFELEEYGLPRSISRKIHQSDLIDLEDDDLTLHAAINFLNGTDERDLALIVADLDDFDRYILRHFFDGIRTS